MFSVLVTPSRRSFFSYIVDRKGLCRASLIINTISSRMGTVRIIVFSVNSLTNEIESTSRSFGIRSSTC